MKLFLCVGLILMGLCFPAQSSSQTLPLEDGAYLMKPEWCEEYFRNALDFVDFQVEQEGRSFAFAEVGCFVHSVKKVRKSRYWIESDCTEGGETFQKSTVLDVYPDTSVRIDGGEFHYFCRNANAGPATSSRNASNLGDLIALWHSTNERCRGGSGDDPNTDKACNERDGFHQQLQALGWCFGKRNQSSHQHKWHKCVSSSNR